jgi:hypothetical protein
MKGLGDSLFSVGGTSSKDSPFGPSSTDTNKPLDSSSQQKDYKTILTNFYQKHNPARLNEVDRTLEKYKVSFCFRNIQTVRAVSFECGSYSSYLFCSFA